MKQYYVYILTNERNGTLYIGVTGNLEGRVIYHRNNVNKDSFTSKYKVYKLVHYEIYNNPFEAIMREKRLKKWNRKWKLRLIEENNPDWNDLLSGFPPSRE